ncbi:MFS transporter [Nocardia goodfellowii]
MTLYPHDESATGGPLTDERIVAADAATAAGDANRVEPPEMSRTYVWLMVFAIFGVFMAFVTPIAISMAIRVDELAPDHEEYLGYITGLGGIAAVLSTPLVGRFSDNTRSRYGRRRPFVVAGSVVGVVALLVMAGAPSIPVLAVGWVLMQIGWGSVLTVLGASQADRLPESQRGRVSAFVGVVQQLAPVGGALMAGGLSGNNLALFLVPGAFAVLSVSLFVCLVDEPDSRGIPVAEPLTTRSLVHTYAFDPRRAPDFGWNWLGKFLFMFGVTCNTTFTAFFLASRMDVSVEEVSGVVAAMAGGTLFATMLGALGGGFLSDRLHRRRVFILVGACIFAAGAAVMAVAPTVPLIIVGAALGNLGLGMFAAVDTALMLDVMPDRETDAGRYIGIYAFSTTIPQAVAPFLAPLVLMIGAVGDEKNYTLLYFVAAAAALLGGFLVATRIKSVR